MVLCTQCPANAIVELRYEKRNLCAECFEKLFNDRVRRAIREFNMFSRGDRVAIAISGGKDSAAVLNVLHEMAPKAGIEVLPFLIDEGIDGYRNEAIVKAKKLCEKLGYELNVFTFKELFDNTLDEAMRKREKLEDKQGTQITSCSLCGVWRRKGMELAAMELGATCIATGHNLDDVAQTFLMNLMRGEPDREFMFGDESGRAKQIRRVKPLLFCPERECALYSEMKGLPYHLGECPYSNEGFRQGVKRFLNDTERDTPGVKFALIKSYLALGQMKKDRTVLPLKPCSDCGASSTGELCRPCQYTRALASK